MEAWRCLWGAYKYEDEVLNTDSAFHRVHGEAAHTARTVRAGELMRFGRETHVEWTRTDKIGWVARSDDTSREREASTM